MDNEINPREAAALESSAHPTATTAAPPSNPMIEKEALKQFYKQDLPGLVRTTLFRPVDGVYGLFVNRSPKSYFHALVLIGSAAVFCMLFTLLSLPSAAWDLLPWFSIMLRAGFFAVILLLLISAVSFGIKLISGKPDFRQELLTGGLCAIPLALLMVILFITFRLVLDEEAISGLVFGGFQSLIRQAGMMALLLFYVFLMFINILQQSLRASGSGDGLRWYLAPLGVLLAFYLTYQIAV